MYVIEQPKADPRSRYESDGTRFLPDSRKNPMSIHVIHLLRLNLMSIFSFLQLPNLNEKLVDQNQTYGVILTMITSTNNPQQKTFVHVNEIKYHTDDAIPICNGSVFIPFTNTDIKNAKKTYSNENK